MFVNDHLIIGRVDGESWQQHSETFSRSLEIMDAKSYALKVWFHTPIIQPPWVECMMGPFISAYESRHHDIQSLNRTSVFNPLAQGQSGTLSRLPGHSVTRKKDSASTRSKNTAGKRKNIKPPEKTRTFVAAPNKDTHKNEVHRKEALDWSALGRSRAAAVGPRHSTITAPDGVEVIPEQQ